MTEHLLPLDWSVEIVATDISPTMLERTRTGTYSQLEVARGLPDAMLLKHFRRVGTQWQVDDHLRSMVTVAPLNLTQPFPARPAFDIVFLRNVLIYFDAPTKARIMRQVRQCLTPGGYMFLGAAETTLGIDDAWERVPLGRFTLNRAPGGPRPPAAPPRGTRRICDDPCQEQVMTPMRALVIDDSRVMRTLLTRHLKTAGFEVLQAEDGQKALDVLESVGVTCPTCAPSTGTCR